jgi:hypothetical protein
LVEVERDYTKRVTGVEEGIRILARLSDTMENRVAFLMGGSGVDLKEFVENEERRENSYRMMRMIDKYQGR